MINFRKAMEEYDNQNRKLTDPNACKSCGSTDFEMTDYCRICTSCFVQEDIPTLFLEFGDETSANLHRERTPKNPRNQSQNHSYRRGWRFPKSISPHHHRKGLNLNGRTSGKRHCGIV
jgi:hypothetical protein